MRRLILLFPLLTAATCAEDYAPTQPILDHAQAAIKDWKAHGNSWGVNCSPFKVYLNPVPQSQLPSKCGVDAQLWACLDGNDIYIAQEIWDTVRTDYVVEHELRHWMGGCAYGRVDGNHAITSYWYQYCGRAGCQDIRE